MKKGCGCTTGILRYIRPPYASMFYVPCCMHDDDYDRGGTTVQRKSADVALFVRMCRVIMENENKPLRVLWLTFVAFNYYIAVRLLGRWYFVNKQEA